MKTKAKITMFLALAMLTALSLSAQKLEDMAGTWVGTATLEGEAEPNELTLVLELQEGKLTGKMTDQYGSMNETQAEDISLEQGVFRFSVTVQVPDGTFKLEFKMKVSGDSMEGELVVRDMGMTGAWEATKQK